MAGQDGDAGSNLRRWRPAGVVLLLLAALGFGLLPGGIPWPDTSPGRFTAGDIEYQLARVDGERLYESRIESYERALDRAEAVCREDRERIGRLVASVVGRGADERDIDASVLWVTQRLPAIAEEGDMADCSMAAEEAVLRSSRCRPFGERACGV